MAHRFTVSLFISWGSDRRARHISSNISILVWSCSPMLNLYRWCRCPLLHHMLCSCAINSSERFQMTTCESNVNDKSHAKKSIIFLTRNEVERDRLPNNNNKKSPNIWWELKLKFVLSLVLLLLLLLAKIDGRYRCCWSYMRLRYI